MVSVEREPLFAAIAARIIALAGQASKVRVGFGRNVALYDRSSSLYQIYVENRCLCF